MDDEMIGFRNVEKPQILVQRDGDFVWENIEGIQDNERTLKNLQKLRDIASQKLREMGNRGTGLRNNHQFEFSVRVQNAEIDLRKTGNTFTIQNHDIDSPENQIIDEAADFMEFCGGDSSHEDSSDGQAKASRKERAIQKRGKSKDSKEVEDNKILLKELQQEKETKNISESADLNYKTQRDFDNSDNETLASVESSDSNSILSKETKSSRDTVFFVKESYESLKSKQKARNNMNKHSILQSEKGQQLENESMNDIKVDFIDSKQAEKSAKVCDQPGEMDQARNEKILSDALIQSNIAKSFERIKEKGNIFDFMPETQNKDEVVTERNVVDSSSSENTSALKALTLNLPDNQTKDSSSRKNNEESSQKIMEGESSNSEYSGDIPKPRSRIRTLKDKKKIENQMKEKETKMKNICNLNDEERQTIKKSLKNKLGIKEETNNKSVNNIRNDKSNHKINNPLKSQNTDDVSKDAFQSRETNSVSQNIENPNQKSPLNQKQIKSYSPGILNASIKGANKNTINMEKYSILKSINLQKISQKTHQRRLSASLDLFNKLSLVSDEKSKTEKTSEPHKTVVISTKSDHNQITQDDINTIKTDALNNELKVVKNDKFENLKLTSKNNKDNQNTQEIRKAKEEIKSPNRKNSSKNHILSKNENHLILNEKPIFDASKFFEKKRNIGDEQNQNFKDVSKKLKKSKSTGSAQRKFDLRKSLPKDVFDEFFVSYEESKKFNDSLNDNSSNRDK